MRGSPINRSSSGMSPLPHGSRVTVAEISRGRPEPPRSRAGATARKLRYLVVESLVTRRAIGVSASVGTSSRKSLQGTFRPAASASTQIHRDR